MARPLFRRRAFILQAINTLRRNSGLVTRDYYRRVCHLLGHLWIRRAGDSSPDFMQPTYLCDFTRVCYARQTRPLISARDQIQGRQLRSRLRLVSRSQTAFHAYSFYCFYFSATNKKQNKKRRRGKRSGSARERWRGNTLVWS